MAFSHETHYFVGLNKGRKMSVEFCLLLFLAMPNICDIILIRHEFWVSQKFQHTMGKNWSSILFTDIETKQNGIESILILQHFIIHLKDFIRMSWTLLGTIEKVFLLSIRLPWIYTNNKCNQYIDGIRWVKLWKYIALKC